MSFTDPFPYVHDVRLRNELMRRYGLIDTEKQDTIEGTTANASIKWDGTAWVENNELIQTSAALDSRVPVLTIGDPNASGGEGAQISMRDQNGGTTDQLSIDINSLGDSRIFQKGNGDLWLGNLTGGTGNLRFYTNGTAKMYLLNNGNVGISDANPSDRLSISCDDGEGISISGGAGGFGESSRLKVQGRAEFGYDGVDSTVYISDAGSTKPIKFEVTAGEAMRITTGKFVGIGTSTPLSALHVKGPNAIISVQDDAGTLAQMEWLDSSDTVLMNMRSGGTSFVFDLEAGGDYIYRVSGTERMRLDSNGNVGIGGTASPASAVAALSLFNGTAPTGSVTNGVVLYSEDVSASAELKVRDEAGNVTTLSPHNFSLIPEGPSEDMAWGYYSEKGGKAINVDMLKMARLLEKLTGEKLVYQSDSSYVDVKTKLGE